MSEIGVRINAHLNRFEADPVINALHEVRGSRLSPYWHVGAAQSGRFVYVTYVSYQGQTHLTKEQAEKYLAWLDAGNVGRHYEALRAISTTN